MPKEDSKEFCLMAYYMPSEQTIDVNELPLDQLTHIIYSFTEVVDNQMVFVNGISDVPLMQLVESKTNNPKLKVMLACGGWGGSGGFSTMAETADNRADFIKSTMGFIQRYQLDGIDLDWEYPGLPGNGNKHQPEDKTNFTALVKELREAMDQLRPGLILTFASAGWEMYFDHIELLEVMKYVDYMNIMTYDLAGPSTPVSAHHTGLKGIPFNQLDTTTISLLGVDETSYEPASVDNIVAYCLKNRAPAHKLVIGAAFYGKAWKGVQPQNNGLYQAHKGFKGFFSFEQITEMVENNTAQRHWDAIAQAPFIYRATDSVFISYDDPESLRLKVNYAKKHQLGGVMFWQLRSDTKSYDLTDALYQSTKP